MDHSATQLSNPTITNYPSGRLYENIVTNGGNVQFGDTYLLNDDTFRACSVEQQRSALLGALDYTGLGAKRAQLGLHEIGTESYSWIESTPLFSWLRSPEAPLFHILGKPASGKSTLMKYLTDSRRVRDKLDSNGRQWTIVHYFFDFRGGSTPANDPVGMVKLFVKQLMSINRATESFLLRQEIIERLRGSDLNTCIDVLTDAVRLSERDICAFFDGLDEYGGSLWTLCSHLEAIRHRTGMKMCLASLPEPGILKACSSFPSLIMQDHHSETIRVYIGRRIDEISIFEPEIETLLTPDVCGRLFEKADRVILWARLALDEFLFTYESGRTSETLDTFLETLNPDLGNIYERILGRIPQRLKQDVALILLLLECFPQQITEEKFIWQAVMFVQTRCGCNTFLAGSLTTEFMKKRLALYLINIVQTISCGNPTFFDDYRISLVHLSLAAYKPPQPRGRDKIRIDTWNSLLKAMITAASHEKAIDTSVIVNEIWQEAEFAAIRGRFALQKLQQERLKGHELGLPPAPMVFRITKTELRDRCILPSWHAMADLLDLAVRDFPWVIPNDWLPQRQGLAPPEALDISLIAWHILLCRRCSGFLTHLSTIDQLKRLRETGDLELVLAVAHKRENFIDLRMAHISMDLVMSTLHLALHASPKTRLSVFRSRPPFDCFLKHYIRLSAIPHGSVHEFSSTNDTTICQEAMTALERLEKEWEHEYDRLLSDMLTKGVACKASPVG